MLFHNFTHEDIITTNFNYFKHQKNVLINFQKVVIV